MIQVEPMTSKPRASSSKPRLGITSAVPAFFWQSWYTEVVPLAIVTNGPTFNHALVLQKSHLRLAARQ